MTYYQNKKTAIESVSGDMYAEVILSQKIHIKNKPYRTYWEIKYLNSTEEFSVGDYEIISEIDLSQREVPTTGKLYRDSVTEKPDGVSI